MPGGKVASEVEINGKTYLVYPQKGKKAEDIKELLEHQAIQQFTGAEFPCWVKTGLSTNKFGDIEFTMTIPARYRDLAYPLADATPYLLLASFYPYIPAEENDGNDD